MNALFRLPLVWALYFLLWLVFVFQVTAPESIAGSVAEALATLGTEITLLSEPLCFEPKLRWLSQAGRLPAMIAQDLWIMSRDLLRLFLRKASQSELVSTTLVTAPEKCEAAAQRALSVLYISMTPNSFVSGGIVPFINLGVGLEVGGGLSLALLVYLRELIEEKE